MKKTFVVSLLAILASLVATASTSYLRVPGFANNSLVKASSDADFARINPMAISIAFRASSRGGNAPEFPFQLGVARFFKNGSLFYEKTGGGGGGRGFNVVAIDPLTGNLLQPAQNFDTWGTRSTGTAMNAMIAFLNGLPNGTLILIAVADEAGLNLDNSCTHISAPWVESGLQTLEALGSQQIRNYCFRNSFAMAAVKGEGVARSEQLADGAEASAQAILTITLPCPAISDISPTSGIISNIVSITGSNFSGVQSVSFFNNAPANFTIISDSQINAIVPAGAASGPITVRKTGCDDAQTASFTVTAPCHTVSNITPSSAPTGGAVSIMGTGLSGVNSVKFSNNVTALFSVVNDAQINATVPAGAVTGPLTISRPGCADVQTNNFIVLPVDSSGPGPSEVVVMGRRLVVRKRNANGTLAAAETYIMTGMNWSPASRGTNTNPFDPNNANVRRPEFAIWGATDIPLMKSMNVNTVRLYIDPGFNNAGRGVLDQLYSNGIMVILTVDDAINDEARLEQAVSFYKNHPAILMWMLGSEWNINHYFNPNKFPSVIEAARATEHAAQRIKSLDANHPVATSYGEIDINAGGLRLADTANYVNSVCPSVDVWSLNIYRGNTFGNLFSQWASMTGKPMFLGEFGTDAFRSTTTTNPPQGGVDEAMQAEWDISLWNHILANLSAKDASRAALGGLVFEFNDEFWKVPPPASQQPDGFFLPNGHPDNFANEEYFGVVTIDRAPRQAYNALATAFENARKNAPEIAGVDFNGKKKLTIQGNRFGDSPRVIINGVDRTDFITSVSEMTIKLKGKQKKLGLVTGDNTVQVIDANIASNVFVLRL
jgi:Interleukin-like EMT inducer/Glycosyl hydrolases family 2, TIM barrel domain/IPT/TIG domain